MNRVVAVVLNEKEFEKIGFRQLKFDPDFDLDLIMKHYEITDEELKIVGEEKIPLLIKERIALFAAMKE